MRHCEAEDGAEMDANRGLTDIGREQAKVMRKFLKLADVKPDVIVSSDFARAVETAAEVNRLDDPPRLDARLRPDGSVASAWKAITAAIGDEKSILVVTHSPLIQQLLASVAFNFLDERWEFHHGAIAYINTDKGRFRWYVDPKLAAHLVGEDPADVETPAAEPLSVESLRRVLMKLPAGSILDTSRPMYVHRLVENLMADSRRATIEPLRDQMRAAVAKRWRKQLRNVRRALKTHTATDWLTAAAVVATAVPFHDLRFSNDHAAVKAAAYGAGAMHASAQLDIEVPASVVQATEARRTVPLNNADDLEAELDVTTVDRAHNALKALDPFTLAAASTALGTLFAGFTDSGSDKLSRADTVALNVVSNGYHAGASDTAAQAVADGQDVEKAWETQDNPCETCIANEAEGFIPVDAAHDSGDFEPPAHPNCACSEVYRVAEAEE
jgi:phosphohistidine phosphatase SixA